MDDTLPQPCAEWLRLLAATHPDDLSPADRARVDAHVAGCRACREALAEYRRVDELIPRLLADESLSQLLEFLSPDAMSGLQGSLTYEAPPGVPPRLQQLWDEEDRATELERDAPAPTPPAAHDQADETQTWSAVFDLPPTPLVQGISSTAGLSYGHQRAGFEAVVDCLAEMGFSWEQVDEDAIVVPVEVPHGRLLCNVQVSEDRLIVESLYSFTAPASRRMLAAEFAARANALIEVGALTVDVDDGDIGFKTGLIMEEGRWRFDLVRSALECHLAIADRWLPAIAAVCFIDITPRAALRQSAGKYPLAEVMRLANEQLESE